MEHHLLRVSATECVAVDAVVAHQIIQNNWFLVKVGEVALIDTYDVPLLVSRLNKAIDKMRVNGLVTDVNVERLPLGPLALLFGVECDCNVRLLAVGEHFAPLLLFKTNIRFAIHLYTLTIATHLRVATLHALYVRAEVKRCDVAGYGNIGVVGENSGYLVV